MPTYEYQCKACGNELEAFQKMSDAPLIECPKCHQAALTKLVSASNFQLKGTGWYATDFKDKGKAPVKDATKTDNKAGQESATSEKQPKDSKSTETKSDTSSTGSKE